MRELVKLKYHKFSVSYTTVEEILTKTEYVILDLVTSFSDIEFNIVSIHKFTCTDQKSFFIDNKLHPILTNCNTPRYTYERLEKYYSGLVAEILCYCFTIKFSEGTPLTLYYVSKELAESEHLKLRQEYKENT